MHTCTHIYLLPGRQKRMGRGTNSGTTVSHPKQPLRMVSPLLNPECKNTRNKLTPHLAEQNAKQADKCSGFFQKVKHICTLEQL